MIYKHHVARIFEIFINGRRGPRYAEVLRNVSRQEKQLNYDCQEPPNDSFKHSRAQVALWGWVCASVVKLAGVVSATGRLPASLAATGSQPAVTQPYKRHAAPHPKGSLVRYQYLHLLLTDWRRLLTLADLVFSFLSYLQPQQ